MVLVQISDPHVVDSNELCYNRVPTNELLRAAVKRINTLSICPDAVIITGDLTDHGTANEYQAFRDIINELECDKFFVLGNHDDRDVFLEFFPNYKLLTQQCAPFVQYANDSHPIRLIGLDTTTCSQLHGELCTIRLRWIEETLRSNQNQPTIIFMHHPPFMTGIRSMDRSGLQGAAEFLKIISCNPQVIRVVCGHIHRSIDNVKYFSLF